MKRIVAVLCIAAFSMMITGGASGADEKKSAPNAKQPAEKIGRPERPMQMNKNISFISGSISKIDATEPENVKVEVLNDVDGKSHVVEIGTTANILKVIEVGELKAGDKARVVARRSGDKEVAISVVTGKLKEVRMPRPQVPPAVAPTMKKDQTKR